MLNWKSRSLGEKVILELAAILLISQINRFDVMLYIGTMFGVPAIGAVLALLVALTGLVLFIAFVTHLIQWLKSMGKNNNTSKEAEIKSNPDVK